MPTMLHKMKHWATEKERDTNASQLFERMLNFTQGKRAANEHFA